MWEMTFCPDSFDRDRPTVEKTFETFEDGKAWVAEHAPDLLRPEVWSKIEDDFRQFGTDNRWAAFRRAP